MCFWFVTEWYLNCQHSSEIYIVWSQICSVICQNDTNAAAISTNCKTAVRSFRLDWIILFDKEGQHTLSDIFAKNVNVPNCSEKLICIGGPPVVMGPPNL